MRHYSIVRSGNEYVVQADAKNLLRVASRRRAAKLVAVANKLLNLEMATQLLPAAGQAEPSITRDACKVP